MKAKTNPVMDAIQDRHPTNQGVVAANPPALAGRLVSKYDEEWVAFVTDPANRKRGAPDGFDLCPRVWNLPYG